MNPPANLWLAPATSGSAVSRDHGRVSALRTLIDRCATHWPILLSILALGGLLLAFAHVVQGAVRQGDLRRIAVVTHANDLSRCNVMSNRARREHCRALLEGATGDVAPSAPRR